MRSDAEIVERLEAIAVLLGGAATTADGRAVVDRAALEDASAPQVDRLVVAIDLAALDGDARARALSAVHARLARAGVAAIAHAVPFGAGLSRAVHTLLAMRLGDAIDEPAARARAIADLEARGRALGTSFGDALALFAARRARGEIAALRAAPTDAPYGLSSRDAARAIEAASLRIVADADASPDDAPSPPLARLVPAIARVPSGAAVCSDALAGRSWRVSAVTRADTSLARPPKWRADRVASMAVRARPHRAEAEGLVGAALAHLAAVGAIVPFKELLRAARELRGAPASADDVRALREGLLAAFLRGDVDLLARP